MAYSSWTSDLKTRLSVGFLGKVVNLLVQAKDRIDLLHTELNLRTAFAVDTDYLITATLADIDDAASNLISITNIATAIDQTGSGDTVKLTLPNGTQQGHFKEIMNWANPGQDLKIYGAIREPGTAYTTGAGGNHGYMILNGAGDYVKLIWSATFASWLVIEGDASVASYGTD